MKVSRFAKLTVLVNCLVPVTLLAWDACWGQLGANPVNFAIRTTGILALIFLMLTLSVTPVSRIARWSWLGQFRRMFGLCAFFHACLHFLIFFGLDRGGNAADTLSEIVKRPYLMIGTFAVVLMVPLAATSTDAMIRQLGGKHWKLLHRLVYIVAIAGVVHFYMLVKADISRPIAFAAVLGALLGYRLFAYNLQLRRRARERAAAPAATVMVGAPTATPRFWAGQLRVARVFDETPDVRTFRLVPPDASRLPFDFLPGQYLNLALQVDGCRVNRSYTIASPPSRTGYCELTVKREEQGTASRHLHDAVHESSLINVSAPAGRFTFTGKEAESIVLIAGGVGITPLMSKIRYLTDLAWSGAIHLVYSVKQRQDIIFREELEYLQRRFPNLHVTLTLSRCTETNGKERCGRISAELLNHIVPHISSQRVHVCGPDGMMESVVALLRGLGVAPEQIHLESFVRPAASEPSGPETGAPLGSGNATAESLFASNGDEGMRSISFSLSRKSKAISEHQTVLEASEELGVEIPYDCRSGICGQCRTRLLGGRVVMEVTDALDSVDRTNNWILSCQARCVDRVIVEA